MSLLDTLGGWLKTGVNDVEGLFSAHPSQPTPNQQPAQPLQAGPKPPQLIVKPPQQSFGKLSVAQSPQQNMQIAQPTPPKANLTAPNALTQNPLQKPKLNLGQLAGDIPKAYNAASNMATALPKALIERPAAGTFDAAKYALGALTHNQTAQQNAGQALKNDYSPAFHMAQGVARTVPQTIESLVHPTSTKAQYRPQGQIAQTVFGKTPVQSIQAGVASNYREHPNLPTPLRAGLAGLYGAGQVAQDLPVGEGIGKGFEAAAKGTVGGINKALDYVPQAETQGGFIGQARNAGKFAPDKSNIHAEDQATMRDYIDMARGAYKPNEQMALNLEDAASTIAKRYGIKENQNPAVMANTFDKILQTAPNSIFKQGGYLGMPGGDEHQGVAAAPERLSMAERAKIVQQDNQQTNNQIELNPQEGNTKGAIAQAKGVTDEMGSRFDYAKHLGKQLDAHDQQLLSERADPNIKVTPHNPSVFSKATAAWDDAFDYALSARRAAGDPTLRFGAGKYAPLNFKITEEEAKDAGMPEDSLIHDPHGKVIGFRDQTRKYRSYTQGKGVGLTPLHSSPLEDLEDYKNNSHTNTLNGLLRRSLEKSNPNEIADEGNGFEMVNGKRVPFSQAAKGNLPFYASGNVNKYLKNFQEEWHPSSKAGQAIETGAKKVGGTTKKLLFAGSPFHEAHITENFASAAALGGEPGTFAEGLANEAKTKGGISEGTYYEVLNHYRQDGTLQYARNMGLELHGDSVMGRFIDSYSLALAKVAKNGGVEEGSQEAIDLGRIYNHLLGRENTAVEGANPTLERMTSYFALAPHYLRTQLKLVYEAMAPKKLGGAGYDKAFKLTTPGGAARSAVAGPRVFGALLAVTASAIIMHRFPTWQDALNESGLNPNNPNPNIDIKSRNSKGEAQVMNLPTDPLGLTLGFITDPSHFAISRESPALSFATKVATNKNWNGNPLADPNAPNYGWNLVKNAAINSFEPIGLQNFTNLQNNPNNPSIAQGVAQEFGLRLKTNPNDPQAQANTAYFNKFTQVSNDLKTQGQYGQYWAQQFANLHPQNTTDANGSKYPEPYHPTSSLAKYNAYVSEDAKGNVMLSPVFNADKQLANATPGYPSSPLYKLSGTGTGADGRQTPQALVALEYSFNQDPGAKTALMNANGGQTGWLAKYENQVGTYDQNYQKNMTSYFQTLGWTGKAINTYWSQHPSSPDPLQAPTFDTNTTNLINQYYALTASGDSTTASTFFSKNSTVLGNAFDQLALHTNAVRGAMGELQLQGYPTESAHVTQVLNSMPQGADSASKKARSQLINSNPDVNQYLANVALYESLDKGDQFRYQNPANMSATEGQNVMAGGSAGQSFLKDAYSLGNYDIGYNPTAAAGSQYGFMQGGGFANGMSSGSASSKSHKPPLFIKKSPKAPKPFYAKKQHKVSLGKPKAMKFHGAKKKEQPQQKIQWQGQAPVQLAQAKPMQLYPTGK